MFKTLTNDKVERRLKSLQQKPQPK